MTIYGFAHAPSALWITDTPCNRLFEGATGLPSKQFRQHRFGQQAQTASPRRPHVSALPPLHLVIPSAWNSANAPIGP